MREIILDTETTGFEFISGHRIVEIGCIELIDRKDIGDSFQVYINPERDIPEDSFKIHGLSADFLSDKPVFSDVIDGFLEFIQDSILIAHNADFDINFLNHELKILGREALSFSRVVDTLPLARKVFPGQKNSLDALCERFRIDKSKRVKHGALIDVELLAEVYVKLLESINRKDSFTLDNKQKIIASSVIIKRDDRNYAIPERDYENHEKFISKLSNPLWYSCKKDTV